MVTTTIVSIGYASLCLPINNHNTQEHTGLCVSQNINAIIKHYLILLISIAANELYVYKSLWVPHAGTGPNHNTQWHSELCFSLNSLTLLCQMSVYANRHALCTQSLCVPNGGAGASHNTSWHTWLFLSVVCWFVCLSSVLYLWPVHWSVINL